EVVRDRDRLVVRDHPGMLRLRGRRPGADLGAGAGPVQVDRGIAAEIVVAAAGRQRLFVRAPTEFGRLRAFGDKAFDRPGVDELAARFWRACALGIALGNVDALDAGALHETRPILA